MTWGEFKALMEDAGILDADTITHIVIESDVLADIQIRRTTEGVEVS